MSDFFLLPSVGIYKKTNFESATPTLEDDFGISIDPPRLSAEKFYFQISKTTTVNVEVTMTNKEVLVDPLFKGYVSSVVTFEVDELVKALFESDDSDKNKPFLNAVNNYIRRLSKVDSYEEKIASIQPFFGTEAYASQLALIDNPNDNEEFKSKQAKSLANIESFITSALDDIADKLQAANEEDKDEEEDEELPPIMKLLDTQDNVDRVNSLITSVLTKFYTDVLDEDIPSLLNSEDDLAGDMELDETRNSSRVFAGLYGNDTLTEEHLKNAKDILDSDTTIRNSTNEEESPTSPVDSSSSPEEN